MPQVGPQVPTTDLADVDQLINPLMGKVRAAPGRLARGQSARATITAAPDIGCGPTGRAIILEVLPPIAGAILRLFGGLIHAVINCLAIASQYLATDSRTITVNSMGDLGLRLAVLIAALD